CGVPAGGEQKVLAQCFPGMAHRDVRSGRWLLAHGLLPNGSQRSPWGQLVRCPGHESWGSQLMLPASIYTVKVTSISGDPRTAPGLETPFCTRRNPPFVG